MNPVSDCISGTTGKLIASLQNLRDQGNSVIVVEHDRDMILSADHIVDLGPGAGRLGGELVATGSPGQILKGKTLTAAYLNHTREIAIPERRREGNGKMLVLKGASGNNLKHVDAHFPLGKFICVTGVSGSGKSTLINETLQPIISQKLYRSNKDPLPYEVTGGTGA